MALNFRDLPPEKQEYGEEIRRGLAMVAGAKVADLRDLESKRTRIKGSAYCMCDSERWSHSGCMYLLIAEPGNAMDSKAVAVYSTKGLRLGYLSPTAAARLSPLFTQLGVDAFKVSGVGTTSNSIVMWVDLPLTTPLRRFVQKHAHVT